MTRHVWTSFFALAMRGTLASAGTKTVSIGARNAGAIVGNLTDTNRLQEDWYFVNTLFASLFI